MSVLDTTSPLLHYQRRYLHALLPGKVWAIACHGRMLTRLAGVPTHCLRNACRPQSALHWIPYPVQGSSNASTYTTWPAASLPVSSYHLRAWHGRSGRHQRFSFIRPLGLCRALDTTSLPLPILGPYRKRAGSGFPGLLHCSPSPIPHSPLAHRCRPRSYRLHHHAHHAQTSDLVVGSARPCTTLGTGEGAPPDQIGRKTA